MTSAKEILTEAADNDKSPVIPITLPTEEGITALAFSIPSILQPWGSRIREVSLDSSCKYTLYNH